MNTSFLRMRYNVKDYVYFCVSNYIEETHCFCHENHTTVNQCTVYISVANQRLTRTPPMLMNKKYQMYYEFTVNDESTEIMFKLPEKACDYFKTFSIASIGAENTEPSIIKNMTGFKEYKAFGSIKTVINRIDNVVVLVFYVLPRCAVFARTLNKMYWTNSNTGTMESYDIINNIHSTVVNNLKSPGVMTVDLVHGNLFWCNYLLNGSIERIDLNGENRIDITKGKYDLSYPEGLTLDLNNNKIYWTANKILHESDFNGDSHTIITNKTYFDVIISNCVDLESAKGYTVYMENNKLENGYLSAKNNLIFTAVFSNNGNTHLSVPSSDLVFEECKHLSFCREIMNGMHCVNLFGTDLSCQHEYTKYYLMKNMYVMGGYKLVNDLSVINTDTGNVNVTGITDVFIDSVLKCVIYYDTHLKEIQVINMTTSYNKTKILMSDIYIPYNGVSYNWRTKTLFFIDEINQNIKFIRLNRNVSGLVIDTIKEETISGLVVHPHKNFMFYISGNSTNKSINLCNMTFLGNDKLKIHNVPASTSNPILIDNDIIYWLNSETQSINNYDYQKVITNEYPVPKIYSYITALTKNYVMTNKWQSNTLFVKWFDFKNENNKKSNGTSGNDNVRRNVSGTPMFP